MICSENIFKCLHLFTIFTSNLKTHFSTGKIINILNNTFSKIKKKKIEAKN